MYTDMEHKTVNNNSAGPIVFNETNLPLRETPLDVFNLSYYFCDEMRLF